MNGFGGMHEERGSAGRRERRADLFADDAGLAEAHRDDAAVAGGDQLDGIDEMLIEMIDHAENRGRLDFENSLRFGDRGMHGGSL